VIFFPGLKARLLQLFGKGKEVGKKRRAPLFTSNNSGEEKETKPAIMFSLLVGGKRREGEKKREEGGEKSRRTLGTVSHLIYQQRRADVEGRWRR